MSIDQDGMTYPLNIRSVINDIWRKEYGVG